MVIQLDEFVVGPAWCDIQLSFVVDRCCYEELLTFDSDPEVRTFYVYWDQDLVPSGNNAKAYWITVTASAGKTNPITEDVRFRLQMRNPCYRTNWISLDPPEIPNGLPDYTVFHGLQGSAHYQFDQFEKDPRNDNQIIADLCGAILYTAYFDGVLIDEVP